MILRVWLSLLSEATPRRRPCRDCIRPPFLFTLRLPLASPGV